MLFANGAIRFTTGLRIEHNSLSGIGLQPNSRVLWKINPAHSVWLAYGLANRSPGPSDTTVQADQAVFPSPVGTQVLRYVGNPKIQSEKLHAFETGYRVQPSKNVSLDLSAFYNKYYDIVGPEMGQPFFEFGPPFRIVLPLVAQNSVAGSALGGEFSAKWVPVPWLRLGAAYSLLELGLKQSPVSVADSARIFEGQAPRHQLHLDSSVNLTHKLWLNTALFFVDRTSYFNVPGYLLVDSKLAWRPRESSEFSIGAKNLFNKEHVEIYSTSGGLPTTLGRSVYGKVTWHF
jgi:iron complex outermembrane receptor protein